MPPVGDPAGVTTSAPSLCVGTASPAETRRIGAGVGALAEAGDLLLLGGDLGAGKTTFTQGVAEALGVQERVTSPTFTLVHDYDGSRQRLLHADVYRLDHLQEVVDLGLPELLEEGAVVVVEWGQVAAPVLLPDHLDIRISFGSEAGDRSILLQPAGPSWRARWPALEALARELPR